MTTLIAGSSAATATFQVDAFGWVDVNCPSSSQGTVRFASQATNLRSNVTEDLRTRRFGPYGVPGNVTVTVTEGSATYTYTQGYGTGTLEQDGEDYLVGPDGTLYPLVWLTGGIEEGYVAGSPQSLIEVDSGSDTTDHAQILWIANCTLAGNPDTEDNALASARMVGYATDSEVYKSGVDGSGSGESFSLRFPAGLTMLHFGLAGESSYTVAAGNVLTADEMVLMKFPEADGVIAVEIKLLTSTLGTTHKRYRQIMVTPYGTL